MLLTPRLRVKWLQVVSVLFVSLMSPLAALASCTINSVQVTTYGFMLGSSATYRVGGPSNLPNAVGTFKSGDLDDLTKYVETSCVPMVMAIKNTSNSTKDIQVGTWFEYKGGSNIGYTELENFTTTSTASGIPGNIINLNQMVYPGTSLKTATSFKTSANSTVTATVTGPYSGKNMGTAAPLPSEGFHHYNLTLKSIPKNVTVFITTCGRLAADAGLFSGGNITAGVSISGANDADHVDVITSSVLNLPTLTLEKDLVGGTATSSQFTFTVSPAINGQTTFSIPNGKADAIIPMVLPSGPFTVTEHGPTGYTFSGGSGTNCTFSASTATANPTPGTIPNDAICVFSDKAEPQNAHFTVNVVIINDNGGAKTTTDFPLAVNGNPVTSGQILTLEPGEYQMTEVTDPLYAATFSGDCDSNGNVTLALGQNKTCTITNNDRPTTLVVTNIVVNDNAGTKVVSDFPLFVNGSPIVSGTENPVVSGFYTITEPNTNGYSVTFSGACNSSGVVTVAAGTTNECIITNDDPAATLTIVNEVINDSGQTLTPADFPATLDDVSVNVGVVLGAQTGQHRVLSAGNGAYITTYAGDCGPAGIITLNTGDNKTCIIRNNDADRGLTVVTHVINDNGGTAVASDFITILQAVGSPDQALNGNETGVLIENSVGFFGVGQAFLPSGGYDVTFSGDCFGFINTGDTKVCTITDNDIAPQLTVVKNVVNNNGGVSTPADFTMNVTGGNVSIPSFAGSADGVTVTLNAGAYSVDEALTSLHYNKSLDSGCSGTIAVGQSLTCTITNDDF